MIFYSEAFLLNIGHGHLSYHSSDQQHANIRELSTYLPIYLSSFAIDTLQRQAHFLGQIYVESDHFSKTEENLNYTRSRFKKVFPHRSLQYDVDAQMEQNCTAPNGHIDRPRLAGNAAYSDKLGNGDYLSDEGYLYRGRGFIQVTGKSNYERIGQMMGVDLIDNPNLLAKPQYALLSACCYWLTNHLNTFADRDDFLGLTHRINAANRSLPERKSATNHIKEMQKIWNQPVTAI